MSLTTLGTATDRKVYEEESYVLSIGFTPATGQTFYQNMMVKLVNDGTVTPATAVTDRVLGRVVSNYQITDPTVRVAVPFESVIRVYSDAGIDEGTELSYSGWDATSGLPKYKTATTGDWVSAIALDAAEDTTTAGYVGVLRCGYKKPS